MNITMNDFGWDIESVRAKLDNIKNIEIPCFADYKPPIDNMKENLKDYLDYKNIILIGHGGSITSTQGFFSAINPNKNLFVIDTPEPDFIYDIKQDCKIEDTLVIIVSKSGESVDVIEAMMEFLEYKMITVTNHEKGALYNISIALDIKSIEHPPISGRYSAFTSSTLVPCHILGCNVSDIINGANIMYDKCHPSIELKQNPALLAATNLYLSEIAGYSEVFMPIYSKKMFGFSNLIVQLIHESTGKDGKGQTFYAAQSPESQHHTNQRFFGGKKNMAGCFIKTKTDVQKNDKKIIIPEELLDISIRNGKLSDLDSNNYSQVLEFESLSVIENTKKLKIPSIVIEMETLNEKELGGFVAFWHYVALYSSILRDVNPFDQPEVEYEKEISFELRKNS